MRHWGDTYRSAHCLHGFLASEVFRESEVDHFDASWVALSCKHKVFGLDVAMADVLPMQVDQG